MNDNDPITGYDVMGEVPLMSEAEWLREMAIQCPEHRDTFERAADEIDRLEKQVKAHEWLHNIEGKLDKIIEVLGVR